MQILVGSNRALYYVVAPICDEARLGKPGFPRISGLKKMFGPSLGAGFPTFRSDKSLGTMFEFYLVT